jgi:diguanylate cyclase (GGDEF)-like protein
MSDTSVDICAIENDPADFALLVNRLQKYNYSVVHARDGCEGLQRIYQHRPKVVICAVSLPEMDGIEVCRRVRSDPTLDGIYFVLVACDPSAERRHRALSAGADEYLHKPYDLAELRARIRNGMRLHRLQTRLERAALTDGLTDLWNHTHFRHLLDREFARTRRYGGTMSLLMLDLDHFKAINDTYGHEAGNHVLRLTARHLTSTVRDTDFVARYGGEEFAIICPETGLDEAAQLAERLRTGLSRDVRLYHAPELTLSASLGVSSTSDPRVDSVAILINLCDQALYQSKRNGRNRVTRCDELPEFSAAQDRPPDEIDRLRKEVYALSMRSKELCLQSIWALIQALDARDHYSAWHSRNVTQYTQWLAEAAGWPAWLRTATANAAILHDLGKIGLPDSLLTKPRPLSVDEMALLRKVPAITCRILEPLRVFETEIVIIRHLREYYDGSGYPSGLAGKAIPIGSRLLAIAEAFDSISCNRAYRQGRSLEETVEQIRAAAGTQFDPEFTELLAETVNRQRKRWQAQIDRACVETAQLTPESVAG